VNELQETSLAAPLSEIEPTPRKPYQKPAFREEPLFETGALSCGKVESTQGSCRTNRKTS
jgi:hypothetical protein